MRGVRFELQGLYESFAVVCETYGESCVCADVSEGLGHGRDVERLGTVPIQQPISGRKSVAAS